jgi:hypothetical protein
MSRGWRAYFITLFLSFLGFGSYGTCAGYERQREIADQATQRAMLQYTAKTRIAKPVRDDDWKAYREFRNRSLQHAFDESNTPPVNSREIGPGDFPTEPDRP